MLNASKVYLHAPVKGLARQRAEDTEQPERRVAQTEPSTGNPHLAVPVSARLGHASGYTGLTAYDSHPHHPVRRGVARNEAAATRA